MNEELFKKLYPDLAERGGLVSMVKMSLASSVTVQVNGFGTGQYYAHVQCGQRSAQVSPCALERSFGFDLWEEGKVLANGEHADFGKVIQVIKDWVMTSKSAEVMELQDDFVKARSSHPKRSLKSGAYLISGGDLKKI